VRGWFRADHPPHHKEIDISQPFSYMSKNPPTTKPRSGQFKCFRCRELFPSKEGDWHSWQTMEVHLCRKCEKETQNTPERKGR